MCGVNMKFINTKNAPGAVGPYSQATLKNNMLFVSGQLPFDPKTNDVPSDSIQDQTTMCLKNIEAIYLEAGFEKTDVVKCTVYLKDLNNFTLMNEAYENFFGNHKPARVAFEASKLPKDVNIEIDAILVK